MKYALVPEIQWILNESKDETFLYENDLFYTNCFAILKSGRFSFSEAKEAKILSLLIGPMMPNEII